eukprot:Skav219546  [mRNA]  locus=scaffold1863:52650:64414:+ [translate_table: standard]
MSSDAALAELRQELAELGARVTALEAARAETGAAGSGSITVNYLSPAAAEVDIAGSEPVLPAPKAGARQYSEQERIEAAERAGQFLKRALSGALMIEAEELSAAAPRPVQLRQCLVVGADGAADEEYPLGFFEVPPDPGDEPQTVALIAVAEFDGRVIVALPSAAWHRTTRARLLPAGSVTKVVSGEVPFVDRLADDPSAAVARRKVWLGLLTADFEDSVVFNSGEEELFPDTAFTEFGTFVLPAAPELVALAEQHFAFQTPVEEVPSQPAAVADLDVRLRSVETHIASLADNLQKLLNKPGPRVSFAEPPAASVQCPPPGLRARPSPADVAGVLKREAAKEAEFRAARQKHEEEVRLGFGATDMTKEELKKLIDSVGEVKLVIQVRLEVREVRRTRSEKYGVRDI